MLELGRDPGVRKRPSVEEDEENQDPAVGEKIPKPRRRQRLHPQSPNLCG
jgi:hypothetical protein